MGFYQAWADVAEESLRRASAKGFEQETSIHPSGLTLILKGLADLDEAVSRLGKGDKRVFKYASYAELEQAGRPLEHETERLGRLADGEIQINREATPLWGEYAMAVDQLARAWGECGVDILQDGKFGKPSDEAQTIYGAWYQEWLPKMVFPHPLPEVPNPSDIVLVGTGGSVPCSGIWEPVDVVAPKIFSLFRPPPPKGPFPIVGCMNYLHGEVSAPRARQETENESLLADVTWRLLWKDNRYEDGTIPEEEKHYVFLQPEPTEEKHVPTRSTRAASLTVAESGQEAPVAGRWLVEDDLHASIEVAAGEELPLHKGRKVLWTLAAENA